MPIPARYSPKQEIKSIHPPKDLAILAERWQESAIKSIEEEGVTFVGHTQDEGKTFDGVAMTNDQFRSSLPIKTSVTHDLPLTTESKPQDPYKPRKTNYTSLSRAIESFVAYKQERGNWTIRTLDDVNLIYAQLTEYLGAKRDPETITREDLWGFVSPPLKLPKNYNRTPRVRRWNKWPL